ncbi:hypothetical protein EVAR_80996_1 [Eumeta japonica]|uniref:Uncharacterized protein n=1 Tax=Eumeta variegata TaxID=151549 RepID=A0A4C1ZVZ9_EUMVA|nr:hypothetical protein EVAR_80996_1 [Eumeta japonica]
MTRARRTASADWSITPGTAGMRPRDLRLRVITENRRKSYEHHPSVHLHKKFRRRLTRSAHLVAGHELSMPMNFPPAPQEAACRRRPVPRALCAGASPTKI